MYFAIVFALKAYHLETEWVIPLFVLVVLNIGMMAPLLPASLGIYQFFSIVALGHFGIEKSVALGFSFQGTSIQAGSGSIATVTVDEADMDFVSELCLKYFNLPQ